MRTYFSLLLVLLGAAFARAAEFTPESAAAFSIRNNRDLLSARHLIAEAEGRLVQAGLWSNPEFQFRGELDARNSGGDRWLEGGFMQRFPWSGRLAVARNVARVDVAMAIEELRDRERQLAGNVLGKARVLLALDRKLAINADNADLLARIFRQTTALTATAKATAAEARVIELEQTTLALAREALHVQRRAGLAELNGLLGRAPTSDLTITGTLPSAPDRATLNAAAAGASSRRPDRQLAVLQVDRSRAEQQLARAQRWEDIGIGASVIRERRDRMETTMLGLGLSIPLPLWNQNQGRISEAQAAQRRFAAALDAIDLTIATEVREAQARVTGLAAVFDQTRGPAVDLARKTTQLIEETYASGAASFLTVYESRRQRLALEQSAIETQEQLAAAISEWETRTGYFPPTVRAAIGTGAMSMRAPAPSARSRFAK